MALHDRRRLLAALAGCALVAALVAVSSSSSSAPPTMLEAKEKGGSGVVLGTAALERAAAAAAAVPVAEVAPQSVAASDPAAIAAVAVETATPDLSAEAVPATAVAVPEASGEMHVRAATAAPVAQLAPEIDAVSAPVAVATAVPALETATLDLSSKAVPALAVRVSQDPHAQPQAVASGTLPVAVATATLDVSAEAVPATAVEVRQPRGGLLRTQLVRGVHAIYAKFAPAAAAAAVPVATVAAESDAVAVPAMAIAVPQALASSKMPVEAAGAVPVARVASESDAASIPVAVATAAVPDLSSEAIPAMAVAVPQVLAASTMPVAVAVTPGLSAVAVPVAAVEVRQPPKRARAHVGAVHAAPIHRAASVHRHTALAEAPAMHRHAAPVHGHAALALAPTTCPVPLVDSAGVSACALLDWVEDAGACTLRWPACALLDSVEDAGACALRWPALSHPSIMRLDVDHAEDGVSPGLQYAEYSVTGFTANSSVPLGAIKRVGDGALWDADGRLLAKIWPRAAASWGAVGALVVAGASTLLQAGCSDSEGASENKDLGHVTDCRGEQLADARSGARGLVDASFTVPLATGGITHLRLGQARGGGGHGGGEVIEVVDARTGNALGALLLDRQTGAWVVARHEALDYHQCSGIDEVGPAISEGAGDTLAGAAGYGKVERDSAVDPRALALLAALRPDHAGSLGLLLGSLKALLLVVLVAPLLLCCGRARALRAQESGGDAGRRGGGGSDGVLKGGKECWGVDGDTGDGASDPCVLETAGGGGGGDGSRDSAVMDEGRIEMRGYRIPSKAA
ncbi:hypothetical protein T484DRAFT_1801414, partial [Baffinella frigidus]